MIKTSVLIGVEIDGAQHYSYNSRWHKDKKDFEQQVRRDARKEELCAEKGIALVHHDARKGVEPRTLRSQVLGAMSVASRGTVSSSKPKRTKSEWTLQQERKQKEYRKKAYQTWKAKRKNPNSRKG